MKTDRKKLYKKIENAISKGVANGEEVDVTAKGIMDTVWPIIDFLQVHGKPVVKNFKTWLKTDIDLDEYMQNIPCEIDEEMYNYIAECVAPNYLFNGIVQGGDPYGTIPTGYEDDIELYDTVREVNGRYYFLGILPEFKQ